MADIPAIVPAHRSSAIRSQKLGPGERTGWFAEFSVHFRREFELAFLLQPGWQSDVQLFSWNVRIHSPSLAQRADVAIPEPARDVTPRAAARQVARELRQLALRLSFAQWHAGDVAP